MISAIASVTVVLYISRSMQTSVTAVDAKSTMTIDLRQALAGNPESDVIIETLVQLGKSLGLKTLAEGVETTGQIDYLREQLVNEAQGFLLSRPLDPDTLEAQILNPLLHQPQQTNKAPTRT